MPRFLLAAIIGVLPIIGGAQGDIPGLYAVDLVNDTNNSCSAASGGFRLSLTFDDDIADPDVFSALLKASIYDIWQVPQPNTPPYTTIAGQWTIDPSKAAPVVINATTVKADCCQKNIIYLCTSQTMGDSYRDKNHNGQLFRYIVNINGAGTKYKKNTSLVLNKKPGPLAAAPSASYALRESKAKDDSNVYVSGGLTAGRKQKPDYKTDIKVRLPLNPSKPNTRFLFDLTTDTNPKADGDSLNIGIEYAGYISRHQEASEHINKCLRDRAIQVCVDALAARAGHIITHYDWSIAGKIESDRRFDNTNLIASGMFKVPIYLSNHSSHVWTFDPFVGIDAGRNLKSPVPDAKTGGIVRPFAGLTTFVGFFRTGKYFPVSFEATHTHRWPLLRELKLEKDEDGNLKAVFFSKRPKYFIDARLNFQFNPFVGFFIGFQRGTLPPLYDTVEPTFKAGITYKFKFKGADDN